MTNLPGGNVNRITTLGLCFVLAALLSCPAGAASFYVSTGGDDSGPGTKAAPWKTLQHAVETIAPGDTILVTPGVYAGFSAEKSGTQGAPKTVAAEKPGTVVFNAPSPNSDKNAIIEIQAESDGKTGWWTVDGFEVDGANGRYRCIDCRHGDHVVIRNNVVHGSFETGIYTSWLEDSLIENNTVRNNKEYGVSVSNESSRDVLRANTAYSNTGVAFFFSADASEGGSGIIRDVLCEKNSSHDDWALITCDGVEHSVFRNNLCYGDKGKGFSLFGDDAAIACRNDRLLNNTVITPADGFFCAVIRRNRTANVDPTGIALLNNILCNVGSGKDCGSIVIDKEALAGFESDYNVVTGRFGLDDAETMLTFDEWKKRGYDLHSLQSRIEDLFVDPAANDYHLKAGSPAVGAGAPLKDVTDDMEGRARSEPFSAGCYQYQHPAK